MVDDLHAVHPGKGIGPVFLGQDLNAKVLERLTSCSPDEVALSAVTVSELAYGVSKSRAHRQNAEALQMFLAPFQVLSYSPEAAFVYGDIRAELEKKGTPSRTRARANAGRQNIVRVRTGSAQGLPVY